jgi:hypothetical protein
MIKKLLKSGAAEAEHVSWTKVGVAVCAVVGAVVGAGLCPPAALPVAKAILAIGAGVGLIGARDAIQK